jgi:hypothetical protein
MAVDSHEGPMGGMFSLDYVVRQLKEHQMLLADGELAWAGRKIWAAINGQVVPLAIEYVAEGGCVCVKSAPLDTPIPTDLKLLEVAFASKAAAEDLAAKQSDEKRMAIQAELIHQLGDFLQTTYDNCVSKSAKYNGLSVEEQNEAVICAIRGVMAFKLAFSKSPVVLPASYHGSDQTAVDGFAPWVVASAKPSADNAVACQFKQYDRVRRRSDGRKGMIGSSVVTSVDHPITSVTIIWADIRSPTHSEEMTDQLELETLGDFPLVLAVGDPVGVVSDGIDGTGVGRQGRITDVLDNGHYRIAWDDETASVANVYRRSKLILRAAERRTMPPHGGKRIEEDADERPLKCGDRIESLIDEHRRGTIHTFRSER